MRKLSARPIQLQYQNLIFLLYSNAITILNLHFKMRNDLF